MNRVLARLGTLLAVLLIFLASSTPAALAAAKPPNPIPVELTGKKVGIDKKTGEYCDRYDPDKKKRSRCRAAKECEVPGQTCNGKGADYKREVEALERWRAKAKVDYTPARFRELDIDITKCVTKKKNSFNQCLSLAILAHPHFKRIGPIDWLTGKISKAASDALEESASQLGKSVIWLLQEFAFEFNEVSTISLDKTGIGRVMGITTALSALIATFLLLIQFAKLAVSQRGGPLVTAVTGLAKWGVILGVYVLATQVALTWSDTFSTAVINQSFGGDGSDDAAKALQERLGNMFAGLVGGSAGTSLITGSGVVAGSIGFVIVISILCILAVGALWVEMLVRQAGIMILVVTMPIALAGQMSDATQEWWPKARNALITLILMKPVIVLAFAIGFGAMSQGEGVRNIIVGLIIFIIAGFSWPALARFMTFTSSGDGGSAGSGMVSSLGSSVSSMFGGNQPSLGGPGMAGGGTSYSKALEGENARSANGAGSGGKFWTLRSGQTKHDTFGSQLKNTVGMGLQLAAVGKDTLESSAVNTAANAGLGPGTQGGRHAVVPQRDSGGGSAPSAPPPAPPSSPQAPPPAPVQQTSEEGS
ncbi:hypothetical protein ACFV2X_42865 [Streptomyces sp. NPDC059679]|uniref:hypothetical protein n=1 Tax=Streptomyces sp. NPDC059679 TaxID=3346903 RepID=UPI00369B2CD2